MSVGNQSVRIPEDARYFIGWLETIIEESRARDDYNNEEEKKQTLEMLLQGKSEFEKRLE